MLVFDIIDEDSFQKVQNWVKELRTMLDRDTPIVIVGNKIDLERNRKVTEEQARSYAESVGATYMETSVKLNRNVNETFLKIAQRTSLRLFALYSLTHAMRTSHDGPAQEQPRGPQPVSQSQGRGGRR